MKPTLMLFILGAALAGFAASPSPKDGRKLVWSDEFEGAGIDTNKWCFWHTMGSSDVLYDNGPKNARVENGMLHLQVHPTGRKDKPWTLSEGVTTRERMDYRYGYLEMRARVPFRHGAWPSFWMQSTPKYRKAKWLAEIDIFEAFSSTNAVAPNLHKWGGGKHVMLKGGEGKGARSYRFKNAGKLNEEFHVYGFEWTPERMAFFVDGEEYYSCPITADKDFDTTVMPGAGMGGFHDFLFIIFNNEIFTPGHGWCPPQFRLREDEPLPIDYWIDWIRLWQDPEKERIAERL